MTIADLLGHRTGLQKADNIWHDSEGELMFEKDQTLAVFNQLRPCASLRSQFLYNNICYAMLGEITTRIAGQPYHEYLKETILDPLRMSRSIVTKDQSLPEDISLVYSTLDNGVPCNVSLPGVSASGPMGSAGGLLSTVNDLTMYYRASMKLWHHQAQPESSHSESYDSKAFFDDVSWTFAPLQIIENSAFREKSYALGWARSQLPTRLGDIGCISVSTGYDASIP